ncbi:hypothetical protein NMG60_11024008 [Bertholletia excelsa]
MESNLQFSFPQTSCTRVAKRMPSDKKRLNKEQSPSDTSMCAPNAAGICIPRTPTDRNKKVTKSEQPKSKKKPNKANTAEEHGTGSVEGQDTNRTPTIQREIHIM